MKDEKKKISLIDFNEYDYKKLKPIDIILFLEGERMNQMSWDSMQPFWRKLLSVEKPLPKRFKVSSCLNYPKEQIGAGEEMIIGEDKERQVTLLESEIQEIIRCIEDVPYGIYIFMNYDKIIAKLKREKE